MRIHRFPVLVAFLACSWSFVRTETTEIPSEEIKESGEPPKGPDLTKSTGEQSSGANTWGEWLTRFLWDEPKPATDDTSEDIPSDEETADLPEEEPQVDDEKPQENEQIVRHPRRHVKRAVIIAVVFVCAVIVVPAVWRVYSQLPSRQTAPPGESIVSA